MTAQAAQQVNDAVDAARVAAIATIMVAIITAAGIVIAAYVARGTRRAFRQVASKAEETAESVDTHNGQTLADYVLDIAEKLNLQADSLTRMHEMQSIAADRQLDMKLRLDTHIEESEPIREYVTELKERDTAAQAGEIDRRESEDT